MLCCCLFCFSCVFAVGLRCCFPGNWSKGRKVRKVVRRGCKACGGTTQAIPFCTFPWPLFALSLFSTNFPGKQASQLLLFLRNKRAAKSGKDFHIKFIGANFSVVVQTIDIFFSKFWFLGCGAQSTFKSGFQPFWGLMFFTFLIQNAELITRPWLSS